MSSIGEKYVEQLKKLNKKHLNEKELLELLKKDGSSNDDKEVVIGRYRITDAGDGKINIQVLQGEPIRHISDEELKQMDDYAKAMTTTTTNNQ